MESWLAQIPLAWMTPLLTARPAGARIPRRLVLDSRLRIQPNSQLAQTANDSPVEICCGPESDLKRAEELRGFGVEVTWFDEADPTTRMFKFLKRQVDQYDATNLLVEGGGHLLGSLRDCGQLDELHIFIGAIMIGGTQSLSPVTGQGVDEIARGTEFQVTSTQIVDGDVYIRAEKKPVSGRGNS